MPSDDDKSDRSDQESTPLRHRTRKDRLPPDFMKYPLPSEAETVPIWRYLETIEVKAESKRCIANLLEYRAVQTHARLPRGSSAAVLVPLFVGRSGDLYVVLSRRSEALRAFAGDTALPGGKVDAQDGTMEDTARREAFEEIGLPQDRNRVPLLCVMEPHLAKNQIVVTPVVVLILDLNLQPNLNSSEVTSIFAQPLISFLSSMPHLAGSRTPYPKDPYHTFTDIPSSKGGAVRQHRFLTGRESEGVKPVFGLTAAIIIKTAIIGYGQWPDFEVQPKDSPTSEQQIAHALLTPANPLRIACEREGVDADKAAERLLRPPIAANAPRTIEWQNVGAEWKKRLEDNSPADVSARVNAGQHTLSPRDPSGGTHQANEENKKRVHGEIKSEGDDCTGGPEGRIEICKEANGKGGGTGENDQEHKARTAEPQHSVPDLTILGASLDEKRDMVNERMRETKGDERKLTRARKAYLNILAQVKGWMEGAHCEDGEDDPIVLVASVPEGGIKNGKDGTKRGQGSKHDEGVVIYRLRKPDAKL